MAILSEIIKLLDAGYSRDEIQGMLAAEQTPAQPEPEPTPETPQPETPGLGAEQAIAALLGKMNDKLTELQAWSILNSEQPAGAAAPEQKSAEQVLGELMHPDKRTI